MPHSWTVSGGDCTATATGTATPAASVARTTTKVRVIEGTDVGMEPPIRMGARWMAFGRPGRPAGREPRENRSDPGGDMIRTKSVSSPIDPAQDGLLILATRFRGRGMTRDRYDVWMPSLGPSEWLLRDVQAGHVIWPAFLRAYRQELVMDGPIDARSKTIKNHGQKFTLRLLARLAQDQPVTLMCHCAEDTRECHRHELARLIAARDLARRPPLPGRGPAGCAGIRCSES